MYHRRWNTNRAAVVAGIFAGSVAIMTGACKSEDRPAETATPAVETPPAATPPVAAETAAAGTPGAAAADQDLGILTITVVDIDTKLAGMCNVPESKVYFKYDSAKLVPEAKERLDELATCVKTGPAKDQELLVIGRTDPTGSDSYNKELGMSRAESVAKYLREQGISKARVDTSSKGEANASADPWHWPWDRRVTLRLQND